MSRKNKSNRKIYTGSFKSLIPVKLTKSRIEAIGSLEVPAGSHGAFFYPKYHFGDFRYCWGNPITFWNRGSLFLEELLSNIYSNFRAGSTISMYFTVGLAIPLTGREDRCLRIEKEYGHGTSIAEANNNFRELREVFEFFRKQRSTKECINWALNNIINFGYWEKNTLILIPYWYNNRLTSCNWSYRNFTKREINFISNKLNYDYYCKDMTQYYYYSSDAYQLKTQIEKKDTNYNFLTIKKDNR